jgi:hypothetical protein
MAPPQDLLRELGPRGCPPRIMLHRCGRHCHSTAQRSIAHRITRAGAEGSSLVPRLAMPARSYGGSAELVQSFAKLPGGLGDRVYFR